jgi:predicted nuclease with TOPRIM domain
LCGTKTKALRGGQSEMTERTEQFRRKALECEQQADAAPDERLADEYLTLAKQWRELADQVERYGLSDTNRPVA